MISRENYDLRILRHKETPFIGIDLWGVDKATVLQLREDLRELLSELESEGYDLAFAHTSNPRIVRLMERVKPLYDLVEPEPGEWVGAWEVKEN